MSRIPEKHIAALLILVGLIISLWQADALVAAPTGRTATIERITLRDAFDGKIRSTFRQGAKLTATIRIKDGRDEDDEGGSADEAQQYIVSITITDSDEDVVYDSGDSPDASGRITLKALERGEVELRWDVPYGSRGGEHKVYASVYTAEVPDRLVHKAVRKFMLDEEASHIYVSKNRIEFGDVETDEAPEDDFIVARRNRDAGDLVWRVAEWPNGWLELVEPSIDAQDPNQSAAVTNTGMVRLKVRRTALRGNFNDAVLISTNAGDFHG